MSIKSVVMSAALPQKEEPPFTSEDACPTDILYSKMTGPAHQVGFDEEKKEETARVRERENET